jgi:hypothetical protein
MWKNLPVEFLNGRFCHICSVWLGIVVLKNQSMSLTWTFFAGLLPPGGEVVHSSIQQ